MLVFAARETFRTDSESEDGAGCGQREDTTFIGPSSPDNIYVSKLSDAPLKKQRHTCQDLGPSLTVRLLGESI